MRRFSWFLILALGVPGAAVAQRQPNRFVDSVATRWQQERDARKQLYLGLQVGMPVYWQQFKHTYTVPGLSFLTASAGLKLNSRWAVQAGVNGGSYDNPFDLYQPGVTGGLPPGGFPPVIGSGRESRAWLSVPLRLYYQLHRPKSAQWAVQAFAGFTPQWQQFRYDETSAIPGQVPTEEHILQKTTNIYATLGLVAIVKLLPNTDLIGEADINQRVYTIGSTPSSSSSVPTLNLGLRFYFGNQLYHNKYLMK